MKHLLTGVAVVAALAIAAPVWAQNPSGGNGMGMPGPNPGGGGGLTPYSGGGAPAPTAAPAPAPAPVQSMNRMPAGGSVTSERGSGARAHHRRHAVQSAGKSPAGSQADQLNRQELSQLQGANPTTMNRMSVGGKATSGGPNQ
jgi:hypothetical protein